MGERKENKKSKFGISEKMLVIVNKDWSRTYVATIQAINAEEGSQKFSAKCDMKNSSIIGSATNKNQLSNNMDEMATIIEDCILDDTPARTPKIAGISYCLN